MALFNEPNQLEDKPVWMEDTSLSHYYNLRTGSFDQVALPLWLKVRGINAHQKRVRGTIEATTYVDGKALSGLFVYIYQD